MLRLWLTRVDPLPTISALSNALRQPMIRYPVAASNVDRYMYDKPQNLRLPFNLAEPSFPGKRMSNYIACLKILNCMRDKKIGAEVRPEPWYHAVCKEGNSCRHKMSTMDNKTANFRIHVERAIGRIKNF